MVLGVFTVGTDIKSILFEFLNCSTRKLKLESISKSVIAIISADYIGGIGADTMLLNYMELAYEENEASLLFQT